jgi:hypothetical protein
MENISRATYSISFLIRLKADSYVHVATFIMFSRHLLYLFHFLSKLLAIECHGAVFFSPGLVMSMQNAGAGASLRVEHTALAHKILDGKHFFSGFLAVSADTCRDGQAKAPPFQRAAHKPGQDTAGLCFESLAQVGVTLSFVGLFWLINEAHSKRNEAEPFPERAVGGIDLWLVVGEQEEEMRRPEGKRFAVEVAGYNGLAAGQQFDLCGIEVGPVVRLARPGNAFPLQVTQVYPGAEGCGEGFGGKAHVPGNHHDRFAQHMFQNMKKRLFSVIASITEEQQEDTRVRVPGNAVAQGALEKGDQCLALTLFSIGKEFLQELCEAWSGLVQPLPLGWNDRAHMFIGEPGAQRTSAQIDHSLPGAQQPGIGLPSSLLSRGRSPRLSLP